MNSKTSLARRVIKKCIARGVTVSTAESCTGGLVSKNLTDVAGCSAAFLGACVTYTNEMKQQLLGVDPAIFAADTEVSHACAKAMADGARRVFGTTLAVSTTGYAGPTGGTAENPVGTVFLALSTPTGTFSERFVAPADAGRVQVRNAAAWRAIELLESYLDSEITVEKS